MPPVRRESLADQAAELLLSRVRAGEWEVGSKLPGETTLAPELGVGRSTVREAIRQLAGRGILTTRQGAGVFVAATEDADGWDAALRRADIVAIIEARTAIEVEASALAAARRTPADLDALQCALDARGAARAHVEAHVDTDMAFHRAIVGAAHSPVLADLFDAFAPRNRQAMIDMLRDRGEHGGDDDQATHEQLLDLIRSGDQEAAASATRRHLLSLQQRLP